MKTGAKRVRAVDYRSEIERVFGGKAFARPLFYSYEGGLRFELSESGARLTPVLQALRKATEVCNDIFSSPDPLVVCLTTWGYSNSSRFGYRELISELRNADIRIPASRSIWTVPIREEDRADETDPVCNLHVAFSAPKTLVQNVLWCPFASDFAGAVRPRPQCSVSLFNLSLGIMVSPYDDRGMDVAGPNHQFLAALYRKHRRYLLNYDLNTMRRTFGD